MPDRSHLTLRLPATLRERLNRIASREDRSVNRQIVRYVRDGLERDNVRADDDPARDR